MVKHELYDLTIIGGGPAGLFAAFYAGLRDMKVNIIEAQPYLGGKVNLYKEKTLWDVGGITPVTGNEFNQQLIQQGLTFDPSVNLNEKVKVIKQDKNIFQVKTNTSKVHYSKAILLTVGGGVVTPQKLNLKNIEKIENVSLHYQVNNLSDYKNKNVLISGGGGTAVDWASELAGIADHVTLIYRGEIFKAHESSVSALSKKENVKIFRSTCISNFYHKAGKVKSVDLRHSKLQEIRSYQMDAIIVNHGFERDYQLLEQSPIAVELYDGYFVSGNAFGESNIKGLFAAGDILHYKGKLNLIVGAFQDAANAVNRAKKYIEPQAADVAQVSSHNEKLKNKVKLA